ncbi:HAD-IC family P-type ATPase [Luteimonas sp. MC1572]|uniref:cation-translocating P-type ATPase n=1 Tax=Luteimonas sp. MC1572 TaxID=2799325 RepID=UPI0018F09353|nr:HAD-IC family P-type ATPase [Luteimonas sp. MC1572]MBJ6980886.1 HAD-IC family P-type ATPase [Luteimonas sp. MC1572]QQO02245.1 HAD-IC family P-type ATPase [Luteimonas sp. MC1572]
MPSWPFPREVLEDSNPLLGLSTEQVTGRRRRFGDNDVTGATPRRWWTAAAASARDPMLWFLLVVSLLFLALGDRAEALVLLLAIVPLLGMDAWLHRRTQASTEGLASRLAAEARVLRDDSWQVLPARELVPGDVVEVAAGDWIPADGLVLSGGDPQFDESSLTGESLPVRKRAFEVAGALPDSVDASHWAHAGTRLLTGSARLWVVHTGALTRYGEIVRLARAGGQARTPLQQSVTRLVRALLFAALLLCLVLAAVRLAHGHGLVDALISALTLAVAALPEEFPVVFTLFLGVGVYRLAQRQALVRRAVAVENIGRVSVICSDKTGTLTEGELRLVETVPVDGMDATGLLALAARASGGANHDPMDRAIREAAPPPPEHQERVATFPFTEERRRETTLLRDSGSDGLVAVVKGAPETVLAMCTVGPGSLGAWRERLDALAGRGCKVIACAHRALPAHHAPALEPDSGYAMAGLLAFGDPVREGVRESVQACLAAGIRVIMVTGDHPLTAGAIAGEIGIGGGAPVVLSLEGRQGTPVDAEELAGADVIARAAPAQKLQLVQALQARGHTVAVTGDGVNDVPALQAADIGIAMGERGTRSAREAAAIVLLDDNFRTLVNAIAEGRQLFSNLQRGFAYLILVHLPLVLSAALVPLLGFPLLYLPIHIVWLELLIHPTAMLAFQLRSDARLEGRPPAAGRVRFFSQRAWWALGLAGAAATAAVLAGYRIGSLSGSAGDPAADGRSLALAVLILCSVAFLVVLTGLRGTMPRVIAAAGVASVALIQVPALSGLLEVRPLGATGLATAIALAGVVALAALPLRRALD